MCRQFKKKGIFKENWDNFSSGWEIQQKSSGSTDSHLAKHRCLPTIDQYRSSLSSVFPLENRTRIFESPKLIMNAPMKYAANTQPFTVLIEGNIGSGKTTFLEHFRPFENEICLITEPVEKWRNVGGGNLLELMYKEPNRWAMPFQSYVTLTMLESHTKQTEKRVKLMERSLFSSRYCFVQNMHRNNILDDVMYNVLQQWYGFIDQSIHIQADLIVYLRTTPEVVYERMKKRARSEESCVPFKLLEELHELHENWLMHRTIGQVNKVVVLDAKLDLEDISSEYKRFEESIIRPSLRAVTPPVFVSPSKRPCLSN